MIGRPPHFHFDLERIAERLSKGVLLKEIANDIGCSVSRLSTVCKKNGIKVNRVYPVEKDHPMWAGGRQIDRNGYIRIHAPDHPFASKRGWVYQHRLVLERSLGRYLKPSESVHHRNGNKHDNRLENLQLCRSDKEHRRYHRKYDDQENRIVLLYLSGIPMSHIAEMIGCSASTVRRLLAENNVEKIEHRGRHKRSMAKAGRSGNPPISIHEQLGQGEQEKHRNVFRSTSVLDKAAQHP